MSKQIPGPWIVVEDGENDPYIREKTLTIQNCENDPICFVRNVANATRIVKCVNMHEELIVTLKMMFERLTDEKMIGLWESPEEYELEMEIYRQALAKAEEE